MKKKKRSKNGKKNSVQELLGVHHFTRYGLQIERGELVFFRVAPTNISVLSYANIESKITNLKNLLSVEPDTGIICTDSCECFDENREYLRQQALKEPNPKVRDLLERDRTMLSHMQAEMANAREFFFVKLYRDLKPEMVFTEINETRKRMSERGFEVQHLSKEEIKRLLAIYFGASMDGDKMPDVDGGQYTEEERHGTL